MRFVTPVFLALITCVALLPRNTSSDLWLMVAMIGGITLMIGALMLYARCTILRAEDGRAHMNAVEKSRSDSTHSHTYPVASQPGLEANVNSVMAAFHPSADIPDHSEEQPAVQGKRTEREAAGSHAYVKTQSY
jgi:hypothetical protein